MRLRHGGLTHPAQIHLANRLLRISSHVDFLHASRPPAHSQRKTHTSLEREMLQVTLGQMDNCAPCDPSLNTHLGSPVFIHSAGGAAKRVASWFQMAVRTLSGNGCPERISLGMSSSYGVMERTRYSFLKLDAQCLQSLTLLKECQQWFVNS